MTKSNKPVKLTLAHINDTHSYFEPHSLQLNITVNDQKISPYVSNGGFARIATRAKQIREHAEKRGRHFLFFHAGDCFQGTLYFSLFKGEANAELLNALGIDAMGLGNHELDMGNQPVAEFLSRIRFPVLAGNWDISNELKTKSYKLIDKANLLSYKPSSKTAQWLCKTVEGEAIAIFGVSMQQMADIANPDPDTPFVNVLDTVVNTVKEIQANGINKIILISHLGFEADKELAQHISGISLIIGGHSHTLQGDFTSLGMDDQGEYGVCINGIRIVQAGYHAQAIGHCEIDFDKDGKICHFSGRNELLLGRRLCIDASLSEVNTDYLHSKASDYLRTSDKVVICKRDPLVHSLLQDKYIPKVRELQQTIVGEFESPLRHVRVPDERGGSELVPLVAESFYKKMRAIGHEVQFAIHNSGGVRCSLNAGPVSIADIAGKLLPFAVPIGVYKIKGKFLYQVLEGAINNALNNGVIGTGTGSYPYSYGLDFTYVPEHSLGKRITQLRYYDSRSGWNPIEDEAIYLGTSSAYTMKGKEGYDAITNMEDSGVVTPYSMADCFIHYLNNQQKNDTRNS